MLEYDFTKIVKYISKTQNIHNCKVQYKSESSKGDGYMGTVKTTTLNGSNKSLNLVLKYRNPKSGDGLPLDIAFKNEIYFYKVIFPTFEHFQCKYKLLKRFDNTPIYYGGEDEPRKELLVFEDLKCQKFDLWNRKEEMNEEHIKYAWKTLAKFHGISFAMKYLEPQLFDNICETINNLDSFNKLMNAMKYYKQVSNMIFKLDIFDPVSENLYYTKFKVFAEKLESELPKILNTRDQYDVIAHGDCWVNNTMYQYEDLHHKTAPKNMKLLDFQMARICSPVFDLVYYFYTSASDKMLDRLEVFLRYYYDELGQYLRCYGLEISEVFSWNVFMEKWKSNVKYGLITAILIRRLMLVESKNAPDITRDTDCFLSDTVFDDESELLYRKQIKLLVIHFVNNDFI